MQFSLNVNQSRSDLDIYHVQSVGNGRNINNTAVMIDLCGNVNISGRVQLRCVGNDDFHIIRDIEKVRFDPFHRIHDTVKGQLWRGSRASRQGCGQFFADDRLKSKVVCHNRPFDHDLLALNLNIHAGSIQVVDLQAFRSIHAMFLCPLRKCIPVQILDTLTGFSKILVQQVCCLFLPGFLNRFLIDHEAAHEALRDINFQVLFVVRRGRELIIGKCFVCCILVQIGS